MSEKILCIYPAYGISGVKRFVRDLYEELGNYKIKMLGVWFDSKLEERDKEFNLLKEIGDENGRNVDELTKQKVKNDVISSIYSFEPDIIHLNAYAIDMDIVKGLEDYKKRNPKTRIVYTVHSLAFQDFSRSPDDQRMFNMTDEFMKDVVEISEYLHFSPISPQEKRRKMKELLLRYNIPTNEETLQKLDIRTYMIALQNRIFRISDAVVFVSDYLRESAYEYEGLRDIIKGKDLVINNGTKMYKAYEENREIIKRKIDNWRKKYHFEDKFIVGYVGRITKTKGILDLILAIDELIKKGHSDIVLILSGKIDPVLEEEIYQYFSNLIGKNLFFFNEEELPKPFSSNEDRDMAMIHASFDLEVYPSLYEPFGLVPLEAISCETPVIVRKIDNLRKFEEDGIAEAFSTREELELLILKYKHMKNDKDKEMDAKRKIVKEKYSMERMRKEYKELFDRMIGILPAPIFVTV
jgi:glycosyltransferase involved in cell wall biosynthesis